MFYNCQVNGISIVDVTHQFAVDTFVNAGSLVNIVVIPREEQRRLVSRVYLCVYHTYVKSLLALPSSTSIVILEKTERVAWEWDCI